MPASTDRWRFAAGRLSASFSDGMARRPGIGDAGVRMRGIVVLSPPLSDRRNVVYDAGGRP